MTTSCSEIISQHKVSPGTLAAWWLGGSGYVLKSPRGVVVYLDPYISDAADRLFGMKRAAPPVVNIDEARFDLYMCSHFHEDHLDPGAAAQLAANNPEASIAMPPTARSRAVWLGVPIDRITPITPGEHIVVGDVTATAVPARHDAGVPGWETPDAVGFVIETPGVRIYYSGDTEYDLRLRALKDSKLDAAILCINGTGGNMNAHEAALLGWQIRADVLIPHHHATWAAQLDDAAATVARFNATYHNLGGTGRVLVPQLGESITLPQSPGN